VLAAFYSHAQPERFTTVAHFSYSAGFNYVNITTDKSSYAVGEQLEIKITNIGTTSAAINLCKPFEMYANDGTQVQYWRLGTSACTATQMLDTANSAKFYWDQKAYFGSSNNPNNATAGTYTLKLYDASTQFTLYGEGSSAITLSTDKKIYEQGDKINVIATNNGAYAVNYSPCSPSFVIKDTIGIELRQATDSQTYCDSLTPIQPQQSPTIGTWNQQYYNIRGQRAFADAGRYSATFAGSTTYFDILPPKPKPESYLITIGKRAYGQDEVVKISIANTGNVAANYSECEPFELYGPAGKTQYLPKIAGCVSQTFLQPSNTAQFEWKQQDYYSGSLQAATAGNYTVSFRNAAAQFTIRPYPAAPVENKPPSTHYFTLNLTKGWNLVSTPVYSDYADGTPRLSFPLTSCVAQTTATYLNYTYNATPISQGLKTSRGYWLKARENCSVELQGALEIASESFSLNLAKGWNLVGAPGKTILASALAANCSFFGPFAFNGTSYYQAYALEPGKGYWLKTEKECQIKAQ